MSRKESSRPRLYKQPTINEIELLCDGLRAVAALMDESHGIFGLHLNGDPSPWSELRTGGRFEEWLVDFDAALEVATDITKLE